MGRQETVGSNVRQRAAEDMICSSVMTHAHEKTLTGADIQACALCFRWSFVPNSTANVTCLPTLSGYG